MIRWMVRTCDFCGAEMGSAGDLIIKRKWFAFPMDSGWSKVHACKKCSDKLSMCISDFFSTSSMRGEE